MILHCSCKYYYIRLSLIFLVENYKLSDTRILIVTWKTSPLRTHVCNLNSINGILTKQRMHLSALVVSRDFKVNVHTHRRNNNCNFIGRLEKPHELATPLPLPKQSTSCALTSARRNWKAGVFLRRTISCHRLSRSFMLCPRHLDREVSGDPPDYPTWKHSTVACMYFLFLFQFLGPATFVFLVNYKCASSVEDS